MADNQEYQNLIKSGENNDLGLAIQNLINDNLRFIRTTYLAKIVSINENKVSIKPILRQKANEQVLIINNCMIAFPYSQLWQTQFKLKVGDIGVAIVIENDISSYKQSGNEGLNNTKRFKDVNDSIFVPLSLYTTLNNSIVNYKIENNNKSCKMEFNNDEIGIFKAKLITLESETTTLKAKLLELVSLLESMAGGQTGPDGHGQTSTTSPGSIGQFNSWGSSLNSLFKD
ncbi:baseplate assembly protein [Campylobacter phage PC22]|nr:hypothetical protein [Campylobacter jejuni]UZV39875.1 baseplate assembly protein [Campylobacter phage PC22]WAK44818.1 baseplate assembly protein [Campylobacter phage PC11]